MELVLLFAETAPTNKCALMKTEELELLKITGVELLHVGGERICLIDGRNAGAGR